MLHRHGSGSEGGVYDHTSASSRGSSQPKQYNVLNQKELLGSRSPEPATFTRNDLDSQLERLKCAGCNRQFEPTGGYPFLDDFVCDRCMDDLVTLTGGAHVR